MGKGRASRQYQPPVVLPARDATQAEVERWWRADRARLVACGGMLSVLQGWAEGVSGG